MESRDTIELNDFIKDITYIKTLDNLIECSLYLSNGIIIRGTSEIPSVIGANNVLAENSAFRNAIKNAKTNILNGIS